MSRRFWAEPLNYAAYTLNRTGKARKKGKTPYKVWFNGECNLHHLKIFGTKCFLRVPKLKRKDKKFGTTCKRGIFLEYEEVTGNYRVWILDEKQIEISRDIEFREIAVPEALIDLNQGEEEEEEEEDTQGALQDHDVKQNRVSKNRNQHII
ncbi:hypothetical protein KM043_017081 [Ampulex compressa]|nr:hypothetical protein KM043_017081 [Ampulex compressa]